MFQPSPNDPCVLHDGKTALILSGGGANGAYEVGVIQALCSGNSWVTGFRPLDPDIVTGTSIGAFNASVLVSGPPPSHQAAEYLRQVWLNDIPQDDSTSHNHVFRYRVDPLEFVNPELAGRHPLEPFSSFAKDSLFLARDWTRRAANFFSSGADLETRLLRLVDVSTFIDNEPTRRLIERHVNPARIRESQKLLKLATTNWETGNLQLFTNHPTAHTKPGTVETCLTDALVPLAIEASAAIPGVFPPVNIDGTYYVDGGTVMNTPLMPAIRSGAQIIHLIYLDPDVRDIPLASLQSTIDIMSRMFTILLAVSMDRDVAIASRINRGIAALAELRSSKLAQTAEAKKLIDEVEQKVIAGHNRDRRPLLIHRYHPTEDLSGMLGMLNFDRSRIAALIERGYADAVGHDCNDSQCLMPDGSMGSGGTIRDDATTSVGR